MNRSNLIESYIRKKATAGEMEEIKHLMKADVNFREEILFQTELQKAVKKEEREKLKQRLQRLEQKKIRFFFRNLESSSCIYYWIRLVLGFQYVSRL